MFLGSSLGSSLPPSCSFLSGHSPVAPLTPSVALFPSSLPSVSAPPGFHSSCFASFLPQLSSRAPTFPVPSPSATSVASSLPFPAPPGFPVAPPFSPLAPTVGLRHPVHSLAPSVAPLLIPCVFSFAVWPCCFISFSSFLCACPCCVFPSCSCCLFFFLYLWLCFFGGYGHFLVLADGRLLLGSSSLFPEGAYRFSGSSCGFVGFPLAPPAPLSSLVSFGALGLLSSSSGVSVGLSASASGDAPLSASCGSGLDFAGASGASDSPDDTFLYHGFDDSLVKGEEAVSALGKAEVSKAFHEVVSLSTSFFPHAKPSSSSSFSEESFPWMDVFGTSN